MAEFDLIGAPYRGTELPTDHYWLGGIPLGSPGPLGHHTNLIEVLPYLWDIQPVPGTKANGLEIEGWAPVHVTGLTSVDMPQG